MVAGHHGIRTTLEQLIHEHGTATGEPECSGVVGIAQSLGLKAKTTQFSWERLVRVDAGVFPLLVRLKNGNTIILVGFHAEGEQTSVVLVDPLSSRPTAKFMVPSAQFVELSTGDVIFIKRRLSLTDHDQPFGLSWFLPGLMLMGTVLMGTAMLMG